jgi:hypothetical protein
MSNFKKLVLEFAEASSILIDVWEIKLTLDYVYKLIMFLAIWRDNSDYISRRKEGKNNNFNRE